MQINNYYTKEKLFEYDTDSQKTLVEKAVESDAQLVCADLRNFNLKGAKCKGGMFKHAHFEGADCKGVDFSESNCIGADFSNSCQTSTNYTRANISYSELWCANYQYSNWTGITASNIRLRATKIFNLFLGEKYGSIIKCNNPFIQIAPVGLYQECLQAFRTNKGTFIKLGSFFDSLDKFKETLILIKENKNDITEYEEIIKMIVNTSKDPKETYEN